MRSAVISLVFATLVAGHAHAEQAPEPVSEPASKPVSEQRIAQLTDALDVPTRPSLSDGLKARLNLLSDEVGWHLDTLTDGMLDMGWNVHQRTAYLRLDTGQLAGLGLRIDSDIRFIHNYARIKTTLDVSLLGEQYKLELPEFEMTSQSVQGKRDVMVRIPLLEGHF